VFPSINISSFGSISCFPAIAIKLLMSSGSGTLSKKEKYMLGFFMGIFFVYRGLAYFFGFSEELTGSLAIEKGLATILSSSSVSVKSMVETSNPKSF
jgi:hypothetical protein